MVEKRRGATGAALGFMKQLEAAFRAWHCRPRRGRGRSGRGKGRNTAMWWLHVAVVGYARASRGGQSFDAMVMVNGVDRDGIVSRRAWR